MIWDNRSVRPYYDDKRRYCTAIETIWMKENQRLISLYLYCNKK